MSGVSHLPFALPEVLTGLEDLLRALAADATICLVLVALAVRVIRARGLHWSWGLAVLAIVVLVHGALGRLAPVLALATLVATLRARRSHRERLDLGADLGRAAAQLLSPLELIGVAANAFARRRREQGRDGGWFRGDQLVLGTNRMGALVSIPFGGVRGGSHTLLVGATGSGKTVTATWMTVRAIERGMGAVVVDPKGDRAMRDAVALAARSAGREFVEWTPSGPNVYNPLARGSETEIADKLLGGERFTEPHYLRQSQRFIGHVVRALRGAGLQVSLRAVVDALDATRLELLSRELAEPEADATQRYLDSLTTRQLADLAGVRDRLAILVESDVGRWLDPDSSSAPALDLLAAIRRRSVVYFALASDSRPLLTQMLGAAIVQDLTTAVASLQSDPSPTVVVIDEFSSLAAEHVVRLFARARSAGVSLILGTQELADLRVAGRELLLEQVIGNLSVLIAHRQVVPSSAELIAMLAGTRGAWKTSQSAARLTRTRGREYALEPGEVMNLATGTAATIVLGAGPGAQITRVFSVT
ncbi:MAG TPA: type IV secretion system DNA-binding domain-containing protein [Solirubrobacteraceae bacterium]|nr:type IV secretion system DNA-binding domain-containing protein [Solirubrobacteraceae bacterium]